MARPRKKPVAPADTVDEAITISKEPIVVDGVVAVAPEVVPTKRQEMINSLSRLFPKAPFSEYDDALIEALYMQHIGTVRLTV